jgi:ParB-like chromosome segregation protein Spo0J
MSILLNRRPLASRKSASAARLEVQYFKLGKIRPSDRNARRHAPKKIKQLADTIQTLRVISPIIVDEKFEILAGHARYEAAKLLGLAEVPIIEINFLSDTEKRAYRLADNRYSERASWDNDLLAMEVKDLINLDFEIELTGFETADVDIILNGDTTNAEEIVPPIAPHYHAARRYFSA